MKKTKTPQTPQLQEPDTQSKRRLSLPKVAYSAFLCVMMSMIFCQPAYAATDVWTKAKEIMQDVYTQILAISTIAAIVTASVALLLMNFSRSGQADCPSDCSQERRLAFMGILDGIVEWIAEQVMAGLDLVTTSVLGALGCDMAVFLRYFPAAETMYSVFVALAIGIILLNWVWQLFKNFGLGAGVEAEDPVKLSIRSVIFILLTLFSDEIVNIVLTIGGTPYHWIMESDLPALSFADFNSVMLVIIGVCANGAVALITLILVLILAWNYLKLLFEAAERYVLLGVLVYTAPVAFSMGASQTTANIWKSWCRMLGGQIFLLVMNAWCLRLFTSMVGSFLANPLSL